jgi:hypothetical protein
MAWGYWLGAVILLVVAAMLWVAYRVWRVSSDWWYNASLYAEFTRERSGARTETQRLALGINLLWMGRGDPYELLARFEEWAADDHVRHVAGDRIKALLETDPWLFFDRAREAITAGFSEEDEAELEALGRPIRDELNEIASDCLIFGEWPFKYWLEHRPSGLEEITIERVKATLEEEEAPAKAAEAPEEEKKAPRDIVPVEKADELMRKEKTRVEPLAKLPPDIKQD